MIELIVFKIVCLFIGVWFGFINTVMWTRGQAISSLNAIVMTFGIVGFTVIQWELWK